MTADVQAIPFQTAPRSGLPFGVGLAVYAAGMAMWGLQSAAGPLPALITIAVATGIAALAVRSRTDAGRRPALAAVTAAGAWLALFSAFGWSWPLTAVWFTLIMAFTVPLRRHLAAAVPAPEPEMPAELEAAAVITDAWVTYVANDGPLKGAGLRLLGTDGRTHRFRVSFRRGVHTYTQLTGQRAQIVSALDVPDQDVIIERGTTGAWAHLTVITDNTDRPPAMYPGPRFDPATGLVGIGLYDDTRAEAYLSIVDDNGVFGSTFTGDQGSGKSQCMEQVALSLLASGYFTGLYVDPQGGMSSPMLAEACAWTATSVQEAAGLVRALPTWRRLRELRLVRAGRNGYTLSKERPAMLVIMDEFQEIATGLSKGDQATLVRMAKTLRKVGGCLLVGTQTVGVQSFGGNNDLRTQLMSRNVVYFYSSSRQQGHLSGSNEFDPSTLPSGTPGYGYVKELRVKGKTITRAAPVRAYYLGNDTDHGGLNAGLSWYRRIRQDCEFAKLPTDERGALGAAFAKREEARGESDANDDAFLARCEGIGLGVIPAEDAEEQPANAAPSGLPSLRLGGAPVEYPEAKKTQAIVNALDAGAWGPAEIIRHAGQYDLDISRSHVEQTLPKLIEQGQAAKVGTGHYHSTRHNLCGHPRCRG